MFQHHSGKKNEHSNVPDTSLVRRAVIRVLYSKFATRRAGIAKTLADRQKTSRVLCLLHCRMLHTGTPWSPWHGIYVRLTEGWIWQVLSMYDCTLMNANCVGAAKIPEMNKASMMTLSSRHTVLVGMVDLGRDRSSWKSLQVKQWLGCMKKEARLSC